MFLGRCVHKHASRLVRERRYRIKSANRQRLIAVIDLQAKVDAKIPGQKPSTYREQLADTHSVIVLQRVRGGRDAATYHNWDQGLTFRELREGKLISQETKLRRELERQDGALRRIDRY